MGAGGFGLIEHAAHAFEVDIERIGDAGGNGHGRADRVDGAQLRRIVAHLGIG